MKWCRIVVLSLIFFLCGSPAWADNCGSLSDCYYVIWNAMLAAGAIGIALSLFLDFLPIIGDLKGIYEGITGRDSITGQELEGWERAIGMIPILGRLGDIAKLAGIAADMARVADKAAETARAAAAAGDTARVASAATDAAKAANAAGDAARAASDAVKAANAAGDTSKAASAASDVSKAIDAAKDASKSANAAADAAHSVGATAEAAKASEAAKNAEKAADAALIDKYGDNGREIIDKFGDELGADILRTFDDISDIPGADNLMKDILSKGANTSQGALSELGYAASLKKQGLQIEKVGDIIDGKKAGDIIIKNGPVIDVKDYNWDSSYYSRPGSVDNAIKSMQRQVELHRLRYPGRPIEYAFTDLDSTPQRVISALEELGVTVKQVTWPN